MSRIKLNKMVAYHNKIKCDVIRKSGDDVQVEQVWSSQLVPGDVIILPSSGDFKIPCDAALVSGLHIFISFYYF